jgi:hypothetical protein
MCRCLILVLGMLLAACSPVLDWRESRQSDLGFTVSLPGKPLVAAREVAFDGVALPMTMVSAGREGTLFAVGVARLPPTLAADAAAAQLMTARFADALRRNVHGSASAASTAPPVPAFTSAFAAGRTVKADTAVSARGDARSDAAPGGGKAGGHAAGTASGTADGKARAVHLYARLVVADDRLYQVVALGGAEQLTAQALDTFFQSFRLLPPP